MGCPLTPLRAEARSLRARLCKTVALPWEGLAIRPFSNPGLRKKTLCPGLIYVSAFKAENRQLRQLVSFVSGPVYFTRASY